MSDKPTIDRFNRSYRVDIEFDTPRAAQAELRIGTAEDAVKRTGAMIDKALTP